MTFLRSWALFILVAIPLAIVVYVWLMRRKRKFAVRYASLSLIRDARPMGLRWRRHAPFVLLLAGIAALVVALGRPVMTVAVSRSSTSIILTLDVSRSMCSTDVAPNRLSVAQAAARTFIKDQPDGVRIGVVAFSGSAQLLVPPTTNTARLLRAINGLTTGVGTAIGSAELAAVDALARVNPGIAPSTVDLSDKSRPKASGSGGYAPDIVVLLTDGDSNRGVDPLTAAGQAADRRVRVYTIGFGTDTPGASVCSPEQIGVGSAGGGGFGGGGGGGFPRPGGAGANPRQSQAIDEKTLMAVADTTGGKYFRAQNAQQLQEVFRGLPARVQTSHESHEISVIFVGLGAMLATLAVGFSLWWNRYP